ncbi:MAG: DNA methyltransferase [Mesorhizobium amorphae]|nr:MAG: DNA methyltransferase [Mesorhizobium amorphae]
MAKNENLTKARAGKNDEFYTQFDDIQREMNAYLEFDRDVFRGKTILLPCDDPEWSNFTKFFVANFAFYGLKKLISTSYAPAAVMRGEEGADPRGRVFVLEADENGDGQVNMADLKWEYLEGDGDFRSAEVTALRDEADFVITNPPFSIFREFLAWIMESEKKFSVIGNMNAITYKDVFAHIAVNRLWLGPSISSGDREFRVPDHYPLEAAGCRVDGQGRKYIRVKGVRWFTNIEHGRRHQPLALDTMANNLRYKKAMRGKKAYDRYDNYDAIDIPQTLAIPADYDGPMGVPISFLDKYCPEQFEILNANDYRTNDRVPAKPHGIIKDKDGTVVGDPKPRYARILIRKVQP